MKEFLKYVAKAFGVNLSKYSPVNSRQAQICAILKHLQIDVVFDVGANSGQFGKMIRGGGFKGRIVSFEPQSDAYDRLLQRSRDDSKWTIAPRTAVGDYQGSVNINVSRNSYSSSAFHVLPRHLKVEPGVEPIRVEASPIVTLDSVYGQYIMEGSKAFLKVDTQGYEMRVLLGAGSSMRQIKGGMVEVSLVPLYEGESTWLEILGVLNNHGFRVYGLIPAYVDASSGETLQVDMVFARLD